MAAESREITISVMGANQDRVDFYTKMLLRDLQGRTDYPMGVAVAISCNPPPHYGDPREFGDKR